MELGNYKIKVTTEAESREAQELFFALGYGWHRCGKQYNNIGDNTFIVAYPDEMILRMGSGGGIKKETTLPQLRDLVVLHRNDIGDATHKKDNGSMYGYLCCDGTEYTWNFSKNIWFESIICFSDSDIKPINKELISGADALRALADGKEVEYKSADGNFYPITDMFDMCKFRLKPRTITLNIEIPAPFEPTEDEEFYVLSSVQTSGYIKTHLKKHTFLGAWKSERDIQQVVSALRGALKNG